LNYVSKWWLAIRPKTLSISLAPLLLGSSLAWHDTHAFSFITFIITLFSILGIQIGTNLYNDAADFIKGADTDQRLGPKRAAQQGWLNTRQIKIGAFISFFISFITGIYLVYLGGLVIVILGLTSILCGYAYTAGPKPIAYSPMGEIFVVVFFGLVAVGGSYYLQSGAINPVVLIWASCLGSIAAAILLINNYRDLDNDRKVNKLTLVHYLGRKNARIVFSLMLIYAYLILFILLPNYSLIILLPLLSFPLAIKLIKQLYITEVSPKLNELLAQTAQLQLSYTLLLSIALILQ
jgi:1,4-dihydroxy-2-naphthoate octaprenyltransferase